MTLHSCKNEKQVDKSNPFFSEFDTPFNVPSFEKIMAKHYMPAFEKGMADGRADIKKLVKNKKTPTFENTVVVLDNAGKLLSTV
jgi:peptidyl-dipeptidase Dcp